MKKLLLPCKNQLWNFFFDALFRFHKKNRCIIDYVKSFAKEKKNQKLTWAVKRRHCSVIQDYISSRNQLHFGTSSSQIASVEARQIFGNGKGLSGRRHVVFPLHQCLFVVSASANSSLSLEVLKARLVGRSLNWGQGRDVPGRVGDVASWPSDGRWHTWDCFEAGANLRAVGRNLPLTRGRRRTAWTTWTGTSSVPKSRIGSRWRCAEGELHVWRRQLTNIWYGRGWHSSGFGTQWSRWGSRAGQGAHASLFPNFGGALVWWSWFAGYPIFRQWTQSWSTWCWTNSRHGWYRVSRSAPWSHQTLLDLLISSLLGWNRDGFAAGADLHG